MNLAYGQLNSQTSHQSMDQVYPRYVHLHHPETDFHFAEQLKNHLDHLFPVDHPVGNLFVHSLAPPRLFLKIIQVLKQGKFYLHLNNHME